jgi:nitrogen regulatory protein PII 1
MPTMIQSVVRPEKVHEVMKALLDAGFPGVTKMDVFGRGKQRGLKVGEITYDELPKEHLLVVVADGDKDLVVETILKSARTGTKGAFGDGKIFISKVDETWTVSNSSKDAWV